MHTIVKVIMITPKIIEIQFLSVYEFLFCKFLPTLQSSNRAMAIENFKNMPIDQVGAACWVGLYQCLPVTHFYRTTTLN